MASHNISLRDNKTQTTFSSKNLKGQEGFTLIEVLVVMGIFVFLISIGGVIGFDALKGANYRSEISIMVSVLERARSRSMNNYYALPSGFCYDIANPLKPKYVLFRGTSYNSSAVATREYVEGNSAVTIYSDPNFYCLSGNGIVFTQLSGNTNLIEIGLTQDRRTSTTTINYEGAILW